MKRKAQVSIEFITLAGFLFLISISLFFALNERIGVYRQEQMMESMMELGNKVSSEVSLAASVGPGYRREFEIPQTISGGTYFIEIKDGVDFVVEYEELEYVTFLDGNVQGNLQKGTNVIRNDKGTVKLNQ